MLITPAIRNKRMRDDLAKFLLNARWGDFIDETESWKHVGQGNFSFEEIEPATFQVKVHTDTGTDIFEVRVRVKR